ncbi:MAG: hypothetical protein IBX61_04915 [Thermoleophilia bacterium]|nr:hypothetical protein [Thermoleophilia bacterium]
MPGLAAGAFLGFVTVFLGLAAVFLGLAGGFFGRATVFLRLGAAFLVTAFFGLALAAFPALAAVALGRAAALFLPALTATAFFFGLVPDFFVFTAGVLALGAFFGLAAAVFLTAPFFAGFFAGLDLAAAFEGFAVGIVLGFGFSRPVPTAFSTGPLLFFLAVFFAIYCPKYLSYCVFNSLNSR